MLPKYIAQVIVSGAQALGRAFTRAVKEEIRKIYIIKYFTKLASTQAAANQETHSRPGQSTGSSETLKSRAMTNLRLGLSLQEAVQILNVSKSLNEQEVEHNFKHLFDANEKAKGGSFYLQSKVFRAKQRIDEELKSRPNPGEQTKDDSHNNNET